MKTILDELIAADGRSVYALALAYANAKGDAGNGRRFERSVARMIDRPETSQVANVFTLLSVLGVDAAGAIAIAASQVKSQPITR